MNRVLPITSETLKAYEQYGYPDDYDVKGLVVTYNGRQLTRGKRSTDNEIGWIVGDDWFPDLETVLKHLAEND